MPRCSGRYSLVLAGDLFLGRGLDFPSNTTCAHCIEVQSYKTLLAPNVLSAHLEVIGYQIVRVPLLSFAPIHNFSKS